MKMELNFNKHLNFGFLENMTSFLRYLREEKEANVFPDGSYVWIDLIGKSVIQFRLHPKFEKVFGLLEYSHDISDYSMDPVLRNFIYDEVSITTEEFHEKRNDYRNQKSF